MPEDALAAAVVAILSEMRGEARMSLESFLLSGAKQFGGTLRIQAPCSSRKRPRYEAGFQSERYGDIA